MRVKVTATEIEVTTYIDREWYALFPSPCPAKEFILACWQHGIVPEDNWMIGFPKHRKIITKAKIKRKIKAAPNLKIEDLAWHFKPPLTL